MPFNTCIATLGTDSLNIPKIWPEGVQRTSHGLQLFCFHFTIASNDRMARNSDEMREPTKWTATRERKREREREKGGGQRRLQDVLASDRIQSDLPSDHQSLIPIRVADWNRRSLSPGHSVTYPILPMGRRLGMNSALGNNGITRSNFSTM